MGVWESSDLSGGDEGRQQWLLGVVGHIICLVLGRHSFLRARPILWAERIMWKFPHDKVR
jgi:hypothetical protein